MEKFNKQNILAAKFLDLLCIIWATSEGKSEQYLKHIYWYVKLS